MGSLIGPGGLEDRTPVPFFLGVARAIFTGSAIGSAERDKTYPGRKTALVR
jgi:hypothetical protein